jgi:hypothetical protein
MRAEYAALLAQDRMTIEEICIKGSAIIAVFFGPEMGAALRSGIPFL